MADLAAAAPAGDGVTEQDVLLATKLHVPRPQPGYVPRRRLVEALSEGLARGRVLVCAPAGFGKTALLAAWARGGGPQSYGQQSDGQKNDGQQRDGQQSVGQQVAWLGLDAGDSDRARFWRY